MNEERSLRESVRPATLDSNADRDAATSPVDVSAEAAAARASHDPTTPPALVDFMMKSWAPRRAHGRKGIKHAASFRARRRALSAMFEGETLVIPTGHLKVRSNDTYYRFRAGSDFYYLTGNLEPDCVLVMAPLPGGGHRDVLYVEPNPGRSSPTFFTDRVKGELWVGPRMGVEASGVYFGVDEARGLDALEADSKAWAQSGKRARLLRGMSEIVDRLGGDATDRDSAFATALSEMRLIKDDVEIAELSGAIASTRRAFEDSIRALKKAKSEREIEGVFNLRARVEGNDVGYGTIAAAGHHACTLHWTENDGPITRGDLLLLDAGVEAKTLYTADITRTIPVSGRFTREQRAVYELVYAAQRAGFKAIKPGVDFMAPNRAAMKVLARGLERLGILGVAADVALRDENQFYRRYSLHNVSHMLGIDVHDCAKARQEAYKLGELRPGMVFTVEPGLYLQPDDLTVPKAFRGIGVRIEDDVVVTERGYRNLSKSIPSHVDEVEAWVKRLWKA